MWKKTENAYSVHHILPRSQNGSSEKINLELLKNTQHRAIHTLFENKMIAEQLLTTIDFSAKALREDVKQRLIETLNSKDIYNPEERYDERAIRF